jgi:2-polyprenyl-3-methyl-5-hydroxy-6-metoxy-1,4-benzoquinol methylase
LVACVLLAAQDPLSLRISDYLRWRSANRGPRSQDQELKDYRGSLVASGMTEDQADAIVDDFKRNWERVSAARWDASLNDPQYPMNRDPNRWLMEAIKGRKVGRALDIGMGTGRNSLFLAAQGWDVTGFDIAAESVTAARKEAEKRGLKIQTHVSSFERFDFGREKWDLIVDMYEFTPVRNIRHRVHDSLRQGGLWVIEGFAARPAVSRPTPRGEGGYQSGELLRLLADDFKIVKYEEVDDRADFGLQIVPLIRIVAEKR